MWGERNSSAMTSEWIGNAQSARETGCVFEMPLRACYLLLLTNLERRMYEEKGKLT